MVLTQTDRAAGTPWHCHTRALQRDGGGRGVERGARARAAVLRRAHALAPLRHAPRTPPRQHLHAGKPRVPRGPGGVPRLAAAAAAPCPDAAALPASLPQRTPPRDISHFPRAQVLFITFETSVRDSCASERLPVPAAMPEHGGHAHARALPCARTHPHTRQHHRNAPQCGHNGHSTRRRGEPTPRVRKESPHGPFCASHTPALPLAVPDARRELPALSR